MSWRDFQNTEKSILTDKPAMSRPIQGRPAPIQPVPSRPTPRPSADPLPDPPPVLSRERINHAYATPKPISLSAWEKEARDCLRPGGDYWIWNTPSRAHWVMAMWDIAIGDGIGVPRWLWRLTGY